jgi:hypothetical protein
MLSIIIINYNTCAFLKRCLQSIKDADLQLDYELIIVDNNSQDQSRKFLSEMNLGKQPGRIILNNQNLGFARANNQAIKLAQGEYIFICNPDIVILKGALEKLVSYLASHPEIGLLGPQLLNTDQTIQYSCCRFPRWFTPFLRRTFLGALPFGRKKLANYLMLDYDHQKTKEVDWLIGAALLFRKDFFEKINGFDERYFLYFEDVDLARQVWQKGKKVVYLPAAKLIHTHRRLSAIRSPLPSLFSKILWIHVQSAIKYFQKWH